MLDCQTVKSDDPFEREKVPNPYAGKRFTDEDFGRMIRDVILTRPKTRRQRVSSLVKENVKLTNNFSTNVFLLKMVWSSIRFFVRVTTKRFRALQRERRGFYRRERDKIMEATPSEMEVEEFSEYVKRLDRVEELNPERSKFRQAMSGAVKLAKVGGSA